MKLNQIIIAAVLIGIVLFVVKKSGEAYIESKETASACGCGA